MTSPAMAAMSRARHAGATPAPRRAAGSAAWIAALALLVYVLTGGGRVVGSDEVTMLELSRAMLRGGIAVPEGATQTGPDGRAYTKNAAAQAVLALPLVAAGEAAAGAARLDPLQSRLAVRFVASFWNAIVTAALLAAFALLARALGASSGAAAWAALALGFTTPLWPYAKSFMAEPLQALGLLLALTGASRAGETPQGALRPEVVAALGAFLAVSAKLSMLPLTLAALLPLLGAPLRAWRAPALGVVLALAGHAVYNAARFGTPFETGYGAQATGAAYTTPLLVGVYGLLLSSGKGVVWFAPVILLAGFGWRAAVRRGQTWRHPLVRLAWGAVATWLAALLLYGRFQHWAGDGSFGPRYLVPVLPIAFLFVALALTPELCGSRARRAWGLALAALGLVVQIGGVGIYFGAQMREAGDYPYTLPLDHPRFMSDSHFNPRFSPIVGHARMLWRNLGEHLSGHEPRLSAAGSVSAGDRLGLDEEDQRALLHGIDLWWLYLGYAGVGGPAPGLVAALLAVLAAVAAMRLRRSLEAERGP